MSRFTLLAAVPAVALLGCNDLAAPAQLRWGARAATLADGAMTSAAQAAAQDRGGQGKPGTGRGRNKKKKRWKDSPVYVDGVFTGMLKYGELPPQLTTRYRTFEGSEGKVARRFAWPEYFAAVGVDIAKIESVHFYGGRNVACVVDGDEIRRAGDDFQFSFTRGTSGFPRLETPESGLEYNSYVDKLRGIAIYVDKEPPSYKEDGRFVMPDGSEVKAGHYPYAESTRHGGTRVYRDGQLLGVFHRRTLGGEGPYTLAEALENLGIDTKGVNQVQLIGWREAIAADWKDAWRDKSLSVPRGSHGMARFAGFEDNIEAVMLFAGTKPADRSLKTAEEVRLANK